MVSEESKKSREKALKYLKNRETHEKALKFVTKRELRDEWLNSKGGTTAFARRHGFKG